jgi:catechol-2,3-dioxygenase
LGAEWLQKREHNDKRISKTKMVTEELETKKLYTNVKQNGYRGTCNTTATEALGSRWLQTLE